MSKPTRHMPQPLTPQDEAFIEAVLAYLDGEADEAQSEALRKALRSSDRLQEIFVLLTLQDQALKEMKSPDSAVEDDESFNDDEDASLLCNDLSKLEGCLTPPRRDVSRPAARRSADGNREMRFGFQRGHRIHRWRMTGAIAAIVIVSVTVLSYAMWDRVERWTSPSVVTIVNLHDVRGGQAASLRREMSLRVGDRMSLTNGHVQARTVRGAMVLLTGPFDLEIAAADRLVLHYGTLVAYCPSEDSIGLIIDTPTARITDLGTVFSVRVEQDGSSDVQVLTGSVEVNLRDAPRVEESASVALGRGQAVRIDYNRMIQPRMFDLRMFELQADVPFTYDDLIDDAVIETTNAILVIDSGDRPRGTFQGSSRDLLQTSLERQTPPANAKGLFARQRLSALTNGQVWAADWVTTEESFTTPTDEPITYYLDTRAHPHGYDLRRIITLTAWTPSRTGQRYRVEVRHVGEDTFRPLAQVDRPSGDAGELIRWTERQITLARSDSHPLASNVDAVRFWFYQHHAGQGPTTWPRSPVDAPHPGFWVFREIDVFGEPSKPQTAPTG